MRLKIRVSFERLGHLNLTGGNIHNIAINTTFFAANVGKLCGHGIGFKGSKTEFCKLERPINETEF